MAPVSSFVLPLETLCPALELDLHCNALYTTNRDFFPLLAILSYFDNIEVSSPAPNTALNKKGLSANAKAKLIFRDGLLEKKR